jgi:hypothetical protein|tara:strand:+ start:1339 stop:1554 length:216 start_codon:yes stop_codon:yes gene_type:complete
MMHFLEIQDKYFKDIKSNIKTFEIRRYNRDYKIKDILILENLKTKEVIKKEIKYINDLSIYNIDNILILGI